MATKKPILQKSAPQFGTGNGKGGGGNGETKGKGAPVNPKAAKDPKGSQDRNGANKGKK